MPPKPREHAVDLTAWGWLVALSRTLLITAGVVYKAARGATSRARRNGLSRYEYFVIQGMCDYQCGLDAVAIQNLLPSTATACCFWARRHGLPVAEVEIPGGTLAMRLGPARSAKVVVFCHGGGYMAPAQYSHLEIPFGFAESPRKDVTVYILQYDLASETANRYPRQLQQAAALVEYLLHTENIPPSSITLLGDSAGSHLLIGLLFHVAHPNPLVPTLDVPAPFSAAAFISPWIEMRSTAPSMRADAGRDILKESSLTYWADNFMGGAPRDPWNAPMTAPADWWRVLPVGAVLATYGEDELLRDDTRRFCEALRGGHGHGRTQTASCPREFHVHMMLNRLLRINKPSESERVFVEWLNERLGPEPESAAAATKQMGH